jgi:MscS family membrane protein
LARTAQRLRAVFDRYGRPEVDQLSASPEGDLDDKLPANRELIPTAGSDPDGPGALALVHVDGPNGARWLISRRTMARVDGWYRTLPSRWLVERLPPWFSRPAVLGLQLWQLFSVAGALFLSLLGAFLFGRLTRFLLALFTRRTKEQLNDFALAHLQRPLVAAWLLTLLRLTMPLAALPDRSFNFVKIGMRGALALVLFWAAIAVVDAFQMSLARDTRDRAGRRAMLGLGGRMLKMVLGIIAAVVVLAELGFSVTSLLAGIGVGGLGLALAAQKTVENVFGAFSLGVDQPFREGDSIKVGDVTGVVESIGLRSTRIRTLDRTLIAMPNGKLADATIESLTARDRYRLAATFSLQADTPPAKVRSFVDGAEAFLRKHEKASIDVSARLSGVTATSIQVDVTCSFLTTDANEFATIRQEMLLGLLDLSTSCGASLASSQAVRLIAPPPTS